MKSKKGFTLMEMMVVVLILAGLAAIAYPAYTKVITKARIAEAVSLSEIVREAQQRYLTLNNTYFNSFTSAHASGRTRLIKANDVKVTDGKLVRGSYTVKISNRTGENSSDKCIIVEYKPEGEDVVFTIYTHVEDSEIWCTDVEDSDICETIRSLEDIQTLDCSK